MACFRRLFSSEEQRWKAKTEFAVFSRKEHDIFKDVECVLTYEDDSIKEQILSCLEGFAKISGLTANSAKTDLYFGGVSNSIKEQILSCTGFSEGQFPFRYLGFPLNPGRLIAEMYTPLISKINSSINQWSAKLLSYAGKVKLLNAVIFGIENYWSSGFMLPKHIIQLINRSSRNYLWNIEAGRRKFTFKSWMSLCSPKQEGGLGIKEVLAWNKAMMARLIWKVETKQEGLWLDWTLAYPLKNNNIWTVQVKESDSESWKSTLRIRDEIIMTLAGLGATQNVIQEWSKGKKFKVKAAYEFLRTHYRKQKWSKIIWNNTTLPRHRFTLNLAAQNCLSTVDNLCRRGMVIVNRCYLCKNGMESRDHLFFNCAYTRKVWKCILEWMGINREGWSLKHELRWSSRRKGKRHWKFNWYCASLAAVVYMVWMERNRRVFMEKENTESWIVEQAKRTISMRMLAVTKDCMHNEIVECLNDV